MRGYASLWLLAVTVVLVVQIINSEVYGNRLRHLTNWAWILNGTAFLFYVLSEAFAPESVPVINYVSVLGVNAFVVTGITYITIVDDTLLQAVADETGEVFMWFGNVLLHYMPILLVIWLLFLERQRLGVEIRAMNPVDAFLRLNVTACLFVIAYGVWFDPSREYPGNKIVFDDMFSLGLAGIFVASAFLVVCISI